MPFDQLQAKILANAPLFKPAQASHTSR